MRCEDLGLATQPTTGDTITINGIVITFVGTLSAASGASEVHIASTVDITRANLVEFLNAYGATNEAEATDIGYSSMSAANSDKLRKLRILAVNSNSTDTMTLTTRGTLITAEALTDGTDTWATVKRHTIAAVNKSMFLALPEGGGEYEKKSVSGKHGKEVTTSQIYNGTIWSRMARPAPGLAPPLAMERIGKQS